MQASVPHGRLQAEPGFPEPEVSPTLSHSLCPVPAQRDASQLPVLPSPAPAIG